MKITGRGTGGSVYNGYVKLIYWLYNSISPAEKLFIDSPSRKNDKLSDLYFPKSGKHNLNLSDGDYIYVVGGDPKVGVNSELSVQQTSINTKDCIKLESHLENNVEVTTYTVGSIPEKGELTEDEVTCIDRAILDEHEFRIYTPEVDKELQKSTDFDSIQNAFFKLDGPDGIICELILPEIYQEFDEVNEKSTKPIFSFELLN